MGNGSLIRRSSTSMETENSTNVEIPDHSSNSNSRSSSMDESSPFIERENEIDRRNVFKKFWDVLRRKEVFFARTVFIDGRTSKLKFPPNTVRNQKYNIITFIPLVLFEQFRFFFNMYFLIVALTQFYPPLQVGFLFTYISPLVFVLSVTMIKEAYDDIKRFKRDREANSQKYQRLTRDGLVPIPSSDIQVGHMIVIHNNQRVPCDCILLRTTEKSGASFIRTDQLDGETDWKLRHAIPSCQRLRSDDHLLQLNASVYAEQPRRDIYDFVGTYTKYAANGEAETESLSLENTLWSNTVIASGTVIALVVYTGKETRSVMNSSSPSSKVGLLDLELNLLSKLLFMLMMVLSFILVALKQFSGQWYIMLFRFTLLFSSIIPISMRVNLEMGKTLYSFFVMRDKAIPGTVVRNSSIPEELGRIQYLFTDKTGTLTQNEMVFKKLNLGTITFSKETLDEVADYLRRGFALTAPSSMASPSSGSVSTTRGQTAMNAYAVQVKEAILALALCHNVTPVMEEGVKQYQSSSPDEIALVKFSESVGLILEDRTLSTISLRTPATDEVEEYEVLNIFPFRSETKRMGIIVRSKLTNKITFYMKGADVVMTRIVRFTDWLEEECDNLAREGLRTLVFGKKHLTEDQYTRFSQQYTAAKVTTKDRAQNVQTVVESLEAELELIGVTGVEDKLQVEVQESLERLRNAGIKIWMLTGDKVETATCIARSAKLVSRSQNIFKIQVGTEREAAEKLEEFKLLQGSCLVIDGTSLQICLDFLSEQFVQAACKAPSVVCCRCSPTQKAAIVKLIKEKTKKRTCAIGDGGNDVSMIQAADCGLGIVGKEGRHASLAADFSINQFSYATRLILWHGRNSYKRSARLGQFVIHRGLIISIIQAVFSAIYYFAAIPIYTGWLIVGYTTAYTMLPVFSLVLDEDVKEEIAFTFPELYRDLQKGRALSIKTFLIWVFKSVYQGGAIMLLSIFLFESSFLRIVSITFTALVLTELLMVAFEVHRLNRWIIIAEILSVAMYIVSIFVLPTYFDIPFILTIDFWWKVLVIVAVSCVPVYVGKFLEKKLSPPSYSKLSE